MITVQIEDSLYLPTKKNTWVILPLPVKDGKTWSGEKSKLCAGTSQDYKDFSPGAMLMDGRFVTEDISRHRPEISVFSGNV